MFGPTEAGKSYTLRGGDNDSGILGRSVNDLFNLVEISKQANFGKTQRSTFFALKMSIYQIYNESLNDLLTNQYSKSLKIVKYEENTDSNTIINNLTQKEVRNKKDYDSLIKEAMQFRKCLAQSLKVNEIKKKSHLVISLILERREKISESYNKSSEKTIDKFAQIDFVELASSNYGLQTEHLKKDNIQFDEILYKNVSKTFNSICNNIVSITANIQPKYESKLSLALKPTLRNNSNIVFLTCVLPWEIPPVQSSKALKFSNWLRNQIFNLQGNYDNKIKSTYEDSDYELSDQEAKSINRRQNQERNTEQNSYNKRYSDKEEVNLLLMVISYRLI